MEDLEKYIKYYNLENYLFDEVNKNFHKRGYLTPEEFFAIIIWKSSRTKTNVKKGIIESKKTIKEITERIFQTKEIEQKLGTLTNPRIKYVGIPIASAILTVLYPNDFTIVDYRVIASLRNEGEKIEGNPSADSKVYLEYLEKCKALSHKYNISLRDLDRKLWAKDFYEGTNGLKSLADGLS